MTVWLIIGLAVATWRTTRLLTRDEFPPTRAIREWIIRTFATITPDGTLTPNQWGPAGRAVAYLWTCPWCMSVWVAGGLVAVADWRLSVPLPWLVVAAGSAVTGLLNMVDIEHDQRYALRQAQLERMKGQP